MTILNIEGHRVRVSDDFLGLSPEEQDRAVDEIAESIGVKGSAKYPFASQINRRIADGVGGLVDLVNPFDQPHALNPFEGGTGSAKDGLRNAMEWAGIEVADRAPETFVEALGAGVGDAAAALLPVGAGLNSLRTAGGAIGAFSDDAYRAVASVPGVGAELAAGGIAGTAEQMAEDAGAPEWVQNTAAIAAPMAAGGAVALGRAAKNLPTAAGAAALVAPYTKTGARHVARNRMQTLAGGPERAEQLAGRIGGDNPLNLTPARQTGDENMLAVEQLAARQNPALRADLEARRAAAPIAARAQVSAQGGSRQDVEAAQAFFEARRAEFAGRLQKSAQDALSASQGRVQAINATRDPGANSLLVSGAVEDARRAARAEEKRLWDAVPKDALTSTSAARARAQEWAAELGRAGADDMPAIARRLLLDDGGFGDTETVREAHRLYGKLREIARNARAGTNRQDAMALVADDIADAILDDLGARQGTTAVGRKINEARAYSAALHETFDQGAPGRILQRTSVGDTAVDPELSLQRTVGRGGTEAAVAARQLEAAGAPDPQIQDYIKGQFARRANKPNGEITTAQARAFARDHKELLDAYPELRAEIETAVVEREGAEQMAARLTKRLKALSDTRRSPTAGFATAQAENAAASILKARSPVEAARGVMVEARKDATGAAVKGVKAAFTENLIVKARSGDGVDAARLSEALTDPRTRRAMQVVFTKDEMARLHRISRELTKAQATSAADIGDNLSGASANRIIEFAARIFAANQGAQLGRGAGQLQTAQMASGRAKEWIAHLTRDKASRLLADAVTDPTLFKALLTQTAGPAAERQIPRLLPYLIGGASVAAGGE